MDMKLFSLTRSSESVPVKLQIKVIGSLSSFTDSDLTFDEYKSLKEMFTSFAKALKENEFIVIAVAGNIYNSTKLKIMNALSLKTEENEAVAQRLKELSLDPEIISKNSVMPVGATVFQSSDGIYSGFAVKKGKQTIAMIPLDENRTDSVLKRGLIPYLTNGGKLNNHVFEDRNKAASAPAVEQKKETFEPNTELTLKTLNILKENDVTIAVNGNTNSIALKEFGAGLEDFDEYFTFTPHIEDKGDYSVTDYTAQMAKSAKEVSGATLGACVSDIYTSDECDYICIAVATDKSALVRKLYKDNDETDEAFMTIAAEELFSLIGEKAAGNSSVGIEIAAEETDEQTEKKLDPKTTKIILSVVAIVLVIAIVTGVLFFVKKKKDEEATTTTVTTTRAETTTQAPVEIKTELLSTIMIDEFIESAKSNAEDTTQAENSDNDRASNEKEAKAEAVPSIITVNGEQLDAKQAIARIVETEMDKSYNAEALKAQAVLTYSYLKYRDTGWKIDGVKISDTCSDEVLKAVEEVFGEFISVDGKLAFTPYYLMSAGKSASSETVFGIKTDYLVSMDCSSDKKEENFKNEIEIKAQDIRAAISAYDDSVVLDEDDAKLIEIKGNDKCVDKNTGYVSKIAVGDKEISGYEFIYKVLKNPDVNSVCFTFEYNEETSVYKFTVYGSGFGVGMSQKAADFDAGNGKKYDAILKAYFSGIKLEKDILADDAAGETTSAAAKEQTTRRSSSNSSNNRTPASTRKAEVTTRVNTTAATTLASQTEATTPHTEADTSNGETNQTNEPNQDSENPTPTPEAE